MLDIRIGTREWKIFENFMLSTLRKKEIWKSFIYHEIKEFKELPNSEQDRVKQFANANYFLKQSRLSFMFTSPLPAKKQDFRPAIKMGIYKRTYQDTCNKKWQRKQSFVLIGTTEEEKLINSIISGEKNILTFRTIDLLKKMLSNRICLDSCDGIYETDRELTEILNKFQITPFSNEFKLLDNFIISAGHLDSQLRKLYEEYNFFETHRTDGVPDFLKPDGEGLYFNMLV